MRDKNRDRLIAYGVAVVATSLSVLLRLALFGFLGNKGPFITFFPAIILSAYLGGVRPGLLATLLGALVADYFLIEPYYSFVISDASDLHALVLFVLTGIALSAFGESRLRSRRRIAASERGYAVTLASIGDAVIATDTQARVAFLNPAAEALTGWPRAEAVGRPLTEVFHIINEQTRQPVEDPAAKVLRLGTVVGLANHTALLTRDGREMPIDDCGAPILDEGGAVTGVVLVFRDVSQRRRAEEAEVLRQSNERMELARARLERPRLGDPDGRRRFSPRPDAPREFLGAARLRPPPSDRDRTDRRTDTPGRPRPPQGSGARVPCRRDRRVREGGPLQPLRRFHPHHVRKGCRGARCHGQTHPLRGHRR